MVFSYAVNLKSWPDLFPQVLGLGLGYLFLTLAVNFFADKLGTSFYLYLGNFIAWSFSALAAAYTITKIVANSIDVSGTLNSSRYYKYAATNLVGSELGTQMGTMNLVVAGFYILWSAGIAYGGFEQSNMVWSKWADMQKAGTTLTEFEAYKYLALNMLFGIGSIISAFAMGDNAESLFKFYIEYNTKLEGASNDSVAVTDDKGTSLYIDLSYHTVLLVGVSLLYSWIGTVSGMFAWYYLGNELPYGLNELFETPAK